MNTRGWIFLHTVLNKFGKPLSKENFREMFLSDLPDEEAEKVLQIEISSPLTEAILQFPEKIVAFMHHSWLIPVIEKLPPFFQARLIGLLPEKQREAVTEKMSIAPIQGNFIPSIKSRILNSFFNQLEIGTVLPKEFLPSGKLSPLLELPKDDLVILIDLLGIHDLAEEMRGIVDQKKIKAIYRCLQPHQHRHLYLCLHQQEKVSSPPLDLGGWSGNCKTLQKKLHVRGLIRLAHALSGQHPDFLWYLTRTLDTGRARVLKQYLRDKPLDMVTPALQTQVIQTINYIKSKSKS